MPVFMRVREYPCKKCKGRRGWQKHKYKPTISFEHRQYYADTAKPTFEIEWVNCPRCNGHGYVVIGGPVSGVAKALASRCTPV